MRSGGVDSGAVVGYKHTMVFYQKEVPRKTDWALNEYTTIIDNHGEPNEKVAIRRSFPFVSLFLSPMAS